MKFNRYVTVVGLLAIALMTGAGSCNKSGDTGSAPGQNQGCSLGQYCPGVGWGGNVGGSVVPGPIVASIEIYGSGQAIMTLNIGAANGGVQGQGYSGPVNISGTVQLYSGCRAWGYGIVLQPGTYNVQGQGQWEANFGGTIGRLAGQLQMQNGGMLTIQPALVSLSSNVNIPGIPTNTNVFLIKPFGQISSCGGYGPTNAY